jgi:hypothetical protein
MLLNPLFLIPAIAMTAVTHDVALPDLKIGDALPAPDVKMMDISNKEVTLAGGALSRAGGILQEEQDRNGAGEQQRSQA